MWIWIPKHPRFPKLRSIIDSVAKEARLTKVHLFCRWLSGSTSAVLEDNLQKIINNIHRKLAEWTNNRRIRSIGRSSGHVRHVDNVRSTFTQTRPQSISSVQPGGYKSKFIDRGACISSRTWRALNSHRLFRTGNWWKCNRKRVSTHNCSQNQGHQYIQDCSAWRETGNDWDEATGQIWYNAYRGEDNNIYDTNNCALRIETSSFCIIFIPCESSSANNVPNQTVQKGVCPDHRMDEKIAGKTHFFLPLNGVLSPFEVQSHCYRNNCVGNNSQYHGCRKIRLEIFSVDRLTLKAHILWSCGNH